jgi:Plasmid encoded RepA protein
MPSNVIPIKNYMKPGSGRDIKSAACGDDPAALASLALNTYRFLPIRRIDASVFRRSFGCLSVVSAAGNSPFPSRSNEYVPGLPYGWRARYLLASLVSHVCATRSRTVELGHTWSDLAGKLTLDDQCDFIDAKDQWVSQLAALLRANFSLTVSTNDDNHSKVFSLISDFSSSRADTELQLPNSVRISAEFFELLLTHPAQCDLSAMRRLAPDPLAIDLLGWLQMRAKNPRRHGALVTWESMSTLFGSEYDDLRVFKTRIANALANVRAADPSAVAAMHEHGVVLGHAV